MAAVGLSTLPARTRCPGGSTLKRRYQAGREGEGELIEEAGAARLGRNKAEKADVLRPLPTWAMERSKGKS